MNFIRNKIILYMLIIALVTDVTLARPIFNIKMEKNEQRFQHVFIPKSRVARQIVQPTWLKIDREPVVDPTVYVNPQSLLEAAEIRKEIQTAVEQDTYVVTGEQEDITNYMEEEISTLPPRENDEANAENGLLNWIISMQRFWHNFTQSLFKGFGN